jgi:hypothetical protein
MEFLSALRLSRRYPLVLIYFDENLCVFAHQKHPHRISAAANSHGAPRKRSKAYFFQLSKMGLKFFK